MPVRKIRRKPKIFTSKSMTGTKKNKSRIIRRRVIRTRKSKPRPKPQPKPKPKSSPKPTELSRNIQLPPPAAPQVKSETISVIIPCANEDAHLLVNLIDILKYQTLLPKEVIISLSGKRFLRPETFKNIDDLNSATLPFAIKILYHNDKVWASGNKNYAATVATGDILIVQDSDDIPHFQRFEIIKYFMDKYNAVHLAHGFVERHNGNVILASTYQQHPFNTRYHIPNIPYYIVTPQNRTKYVITNGEIAILRSIWSKHKWDNSLRVAEDTTYNRNIEQTYKSTIYITKPLIIYNRVLQSI